MIKRRKSNDLRSRSNRRQLPRWARADQDQQRARRRLLQRLQQAVCARNAKVVGVVNDGNFPLPKKWLEADAVAQPLLIAMLIVANK
jgi:hypothetical protein